MTIVDGLWGCQQCQRLKKPKTCSLAKFQRIPGNESPSQRLICLAIVLVQWTLCWLPSLNSHSSAHRGAIDPGPFSTAREFPADDFRHWKCLKSPFQAWLIRVQSSDTKGDFWAIFGWTSSFYWFSLFLLPLSRFWLIPFKPPSLLPRTGGYKEKVLSSTNQYRRNLHLRRT